MNAKVIKVSDGVVTVRVNRSSKVNDLYHRNYDLRVGDTVIVKRQVNNPYLVFVEKVQK